MVTTHRAAAGQQMTAKETRDKQAEEREPLSGSALGRTPAPARPRDDAEPDQGMVRLRTEVAGQHRDARRSNRAESGWDDALESVIRERTRRLGTLRDSEKEDPERDVVRGVVVAPAAEAGRANRGLPKTKTKAQLGRRAGSKIVTTDLHRVAKRAGEVPVSQHRAKSWIAYCMG